jgi:preprotein translocase subunit SecG
MVTFLMVIHIIVVAALIGIILIQKSEGGALGLGGSGGGGGMGGFMTARGSANLLTRTTGILATLFFLSTLVLALMVKGTHKEKSILIEDDTKATASAGATPGHHPAQPQADETKKQGQ